MDFGSICRNILRLNGCEDIKDEDSYCSFVECSLDKASEYPPLDLEALAYADEVLMENEFQVPFEPFKDNASSASLKEASEINPNWLLNTLSNVSSIWKCEELAQRIMDTLVSSPSDHIENDLLELLGFENFELASKLLQQKEALITACKGVNFISKSTTNIVIPEAPLPGQQITLTTKGTKEAIKNYRKMVAKGQIIEESNEIPMNNDLQKFIQSADQVKVKYPNVYLTPRSNVPLGGKLALPSDTKHNDYSDHEEFIIPHIQKITSITDTIHSISISEIDDFIAPAFPSYKSLNKMQSAVFPIAYYSSENMLVCAPTGAGKTDVAMLTVLKTIRDFTIQEGDHLMISKNDFKIIYVAPMKALAAEITAKFAKRLRPYGIKAKEYTGDMQLTRQEVNSTQMIVTTPEKWDVITRKGQGDVDLVQKVALLIIDEVHLLQDDRGPVIETLVARTLRQVEIEQRLIRIVGLSATLPNYIDVASFLRVDPYSGLFVFGDAFRPVPLTQHFIGIKGRSHSTFIENMNKVCFEKCRDFLIDKHQVMIFVHSRNETVKTAKLLLKYAVEEGFASLLIPEDAANPSYISAKKRMETSRNRELYSLFQSGLVFHNAGMLRSDRSMVEEFFEAGHARVLLCTSTLAWGVNLPAHAVIIKGTQVYDQQKADFVQLGILDVLQIFGRAGRPQYESHGEGLILTAHEHMTRYISAILSQVPIESQFLSHLADNLNAEVVLGTVNSINEATSWLKYSYLYVRMKRNPTAYGISMKEINLDPDLEERLQKICRDSFKELAQCGMIHFDNDSGVVRSTDVGRIAAHFYLSKSTIETFGKILRPTMSEDEILAAVSLASEFDNLRVREEELRELDDLKQHLPMRLKHDVATPAGKASLLIMAHISRYSMDTFSLVSDANYISQNAGRIFRALFEIFRTQRWTCSFLRCLTLCKSFERKLWPLNHPIYQFSKISLEVIRSLEAKKLNMDLLSSMSKSELSSIVGSPRATDSISVMLRQFPAINASASIYPITQNILRVEVQIEAQFNYDNSIHGSSDLWWIVLEDPLSTEYLHCEEFVVTKMNVYSPRTVYFHIPLPTSLSKTHQWILKITSDRWLHAEALLPVSLNNLVIPKELAVSYTELTTTECLPISAIGESLIESLYSIPSFNRVQSQVFSSLYNGDMNALVGAPTGSGKTIIAELALWRAYKLYASKKIVYVAPLKALIKERYGDWRGKLGKVGLNVSEISGDVSCDSATLKKSNIILTTPEKFDIISRNNGILASDISLVIIDEIHLLGGDRGHVLEALVSRLSFMAPSIRWVGLSTALANAGDLARWLNVPESGLFNFRPSVRPVPVDVHIEGFAGRHYCPRMATMNKPIYSYILSLSPTKPVLVFVSSRRQTRLTANSLVSYCSYDNTPYRFLRSPESLDSVIEQIQDPSLRHVLAFGVALHHAGLVDSDRHICESLFATGKIQVMVATSTLAWGLNFPAHLVVIKGTEYFDARSQSYIEYPLTDVLQMIGRAGRPQFDTSAKAVILLQDSKKEFYRKFLYESFPLESSLNLLSRFADHLNAEIYNERVGSFSEALNMLKRTYLALRIESNPNYYGIKDVKQAKEYLSELIKDSVMKLKDAGCVEEYMDGSGDRKFKSTSLGRIASSFYLSHCTIQLYSQSIQSDSSFFHLLRLFSLATEFEESPLRHNEDIETKEFVESPLMKKIWQQVTDGIAFDFSSPHTKVLSLLVAHLSRVPLPFTDFITDLRSVLDQSRRIVMAMVEICLLTGSGDVVIRCIWLLQSLSQGLFPQLNSLLQLPHLDSVNIPSNESLPSLLHCNIEDVICKLKAWGVPPPDQENVINVLCERIPQIKINIRTLKWPQSNEMGVTLQVQKFNSENQVYHREYSKTQDESWRILILSRETGTVLVHRRVSLHSKVNSIGSLRFTPPQPTKIIFLSEDYLSLDQEYLIN